MSILDTGFAPLDDDGLKFANYSGITKITLLQAYSYLVIISVNRLHRESYFTGWENWLFRNPQYIEQED